MGNMTGKEWSEVPAEIQAHVAEKLVTSGKWTHPPLVHWGDYYEDRPSLYGLHERAVGNFKYVQKEMLKMLTDRDEMLKQQQMHKMYSELMPKVDRDTAKQQMGAWIADYFDDAGYTDWEKDSTMFKAMLMTAFPPIDALDDEKPDYGSIPIDQWEDHVTKFLSVMDSHLASEQRRLRGSKATSNTLFSLIKRR